MHDRITDEAEAALHKHSVRTCRKGSGRKIHLTYGGQTTFCHSGGQTFTRVWAINQIKIQDAIEKGILCEKCLHNYCPELDLAEGFPTGTVDDPAYGC